MNYHELQKGRYSALLSNVIRFSIAGAFIWWLFRSGSLRPEYLIVPFGRISLLLRGVLLLLLAMSISAVRYRLLLRGSGVSITPVESLKAGALTYFFTQCAFGPACGDVARFIYTAKITGKRSGTGAAIIADRFIGTMGLFMLAVLGLVMNWSLVESSSTLRLIAVPMLSLFSCLWFGFVFGAIALIKNRLTAFAAWLPFPLLSVFLCFGRLSDFLGREVGPVLLAVSFIDLAVVLLVPELQEGGFIREKLLRGTKPGLWADEIVSALLLYRNKPSILPVTVAVTAVQHLLFIMVLYLFALAQNLPVSPDLSEIFFAAPTAFLAGIIPAPAAGLGVNEAAFEALLRIASGHVVSTGASIYLMLRIWMTLFSLAGIPVMMGAGIKKLSS